MVVYVTHSFFPNISRLKNLWITQIKTFSTKISNQWPKKVTLMEVGARDGLQNEPKLLPTAVKLNLINKLVDAGIRNIEAASFVSPKWVPQMGDHKEVMLGLDKQDGVNYIALVPNVRGLEIAMKCNVKAIALFTAASESFCQQNVNSSIEETLAKAKEIMKLAQSNGISARGYISCVIACPYEGPIDPKKVAEVAKLLYDMKCYEIALGDTIGVGTPGSVARMLEEVLKVVPADKLAVHFHDTYGQALANILVAIQMGITTIDSSIAGLGGCPYATGATGNVATEDLVYMLNGMGIATGIDIDKLILVSNYICHQLGKECSSRVGRALSRKLS